MYGKIKPWVDRVLVKQPPHQRRVPSPYWIPAARRELAAACSSGCLAALTAERQQQLPSAHGDPLGRGRRGGRGTPLSLHGILSSQYCSKTLYEFYNLLGGALAEEHLPRRGFPPHPLHPAGTSRCPLLTPVSERALTSRCCIMGLQGMATGSENRAGGAAKARMNGSKDINAMFYEGQVLVEKLESMDSSSAEFKEALDRGIALLEVRPTHIARQGHSYRASLRGGFPCALWVLDLFRICSLLLTPIM
jgi:hypothetical protein